MKTDMVIDDRGALSRKIKVSMGTGWNRTKPAAVIVQFL